MKKSFLTLLGLLALAGTSSAAENQAAPAPSKPQTHCPVMGGKIDSTVFTDIQGQRVYHCCPGCQEKLVADPDKYFKKAFEKGIVFENIQTACPVTGKPIDKSVVTNYEGRRIYFADSAAMATFAKEPAKYLAVLDQQNKPKEDDKAVEKKHEAGHSH